MLTCHALSKGAIGFLTASLVVCLLGWSDVRAQKPARGIPLSSAQQSLEPIFQSSRRVHVFQTRSVAGGRIDDASGVMRAMYGLAASSTPGIPRVSARSFLSEQATVLGLDSSLDDLQEIDFVSTPFSHHLTYQQHVGTIPVHNRFVKVNLDKEGRVTMVLNGYAPRVGQASVQTQPSLSEADAVEAVRNQVASPGGRVSPGTLVVYPGDVPRLAWRVVVWSSAPAYELEVLIDAISGEVLYLQPLSSHVHGVSDRGVDGISHGENRNVLPDTGPRPETVNRAIGTGLVFNPDPLSTSGQFYGGSFIDAEDTDRPELNNERKLVTLLDISQGTDGLYRLIGPHVEITGVNLNGDMVYTPPAEATPDGFKYTRSNDFFEAVNAYYHVDKSQRYVQSLHVGRDIQNGPIAVSPHGLGSLDNSGYHPETNLLLFGQGGVDDAEDAEVIWHEYGHALLDASAPSLTITSEGNAFHEGWSDYWTASYTRSLAESGQLARQDWTSLFKWDSGEGDFWAGRSLGATGVYPEDILCDVESECTLNQIYIDGLFWASMLMEVYDQIGREQTDRLNLVSHAYLSAPMTFRDAAQALIQADLDLNNGVHLDILVEILEERGLLEGPLIVHNPLPDTEQLGGVIPVIVEVSGISVAMSRVFVVYSHSEVVSDTLHLTLTGDREYSGLMPLPAAPGQVSYHINVINELGLVSKMPSSPQGVDYTFLVGPDTNPPGIVHAQPAPLPLVDWPATISARVNDNVGVDSVRVEYYIESPEGQRRVEGLGELVEVSGEYQFTFPEPIEQVEPGSVIAYRLIATDAATAPNTSQAPESGYYSFSIILENGLFRVYTFEQDIQGFAATGMWERATPSFGVRVAHSGENVWAIEPAGPYLAASQRSSLTLPPLDVQTPNVDSVYLSFWHWYDIEDAGQATPEGDESAVLWDGGNIKISMDGGTTWDILEPNSGYNGRISSSRNNPMGGEPAFGGFSYGWRRVVAPLPQGQSILLRFDFGTDAEDATNPSVHAGWYIDDVRVITERPNDNQAPFATSLPDTVIVKAVTEAVPKLVVGFTDNTGVGSVIVDYSLSNLGEMVSEGQFRLSMDSTNLHVFHGSFPVDPVFLDIGTVLSYRLQVQDFDGNTTVQPAESEDPLRIEYRLINQVDLLADMQPSGLWGFEDNAWDFANRNSPSPVSSLVAGPIDLPINADEVQLQLQFMQQIATGNGGNVKISSDGAQQWHVLQPIGGYATTLPTDSSVPEVMRGQDVFSGDVDGLQEAVFDLAAYAQQQIWLRVDYTSREAIQEGETWEIREASLQYSTLETVNNGFDIPVSFALHENFPDPFSNITRISYSLEEPTPVLMEVFDMLGRRVEVLVQGDQNAGTYSFVFDGSSLASGLYLLRLVTRQGQRVERMIVTR